LGFARGLAAGFLAAGFFFGADFFLTPPAGLVLAAFFAGFFLMAPFFAGFASAFAQLR